MAEQTRTYAYGEVKKGGDQTARMLKVIVGLCAGIFLVVLISALILVPRIALAAGSADTALRELGTLLESGDAAAAIEELRALLESGDLTEMLAELEQLIGESRSSMASAAEKIDALDIEALNDAIANLSRVIEPLARLFGN